jgi:hypothetical protein
VNGVNIRDFGSADDSVGPEVAVRTFGSTYAYRFVSQLDVKRLYVRFRIDGQALDAQFTASTDDAKGDFAAISDEDFLNH